MNAVSPKGSVTVEAVNMTLLYDPNEPAALNCMASGGPNNTFMWFLDGDLINETSNTLVFNEVEGGEYTCQVSNAAGNENASITLIGKYIIIMVH
jgi:membrane carboxypeptidase/penicillin-binding protein PbpC